MESDNGCFFDALEVFDGNSTDANNRLAKLCGNQLPNPIVSTSHELLIRFRSDESVTKRGFNLRFNDTGILLFFFCSGLATVHYFLVVRHASTKCRELWVILQLSVESVVSKVKYDNVTLNLNVIAEQILKCLRIRFFAIVVFVVFSCDCSLNSETAIIANTTIVETRRKKVIRSVS